MGAHPSLLKDDFTGLLLSLFLCLIKKNTRLPCIRIQGSLVFFFSCILEAEVQHCNNVCDIVRESRSALKEEACGNLVKIVSALFVLGLFIWYL